MIPRQTLYSVEAVHHCTCGNPVTNHVLSRKIHISCGKSVYVHLGIIFDEFVIFDDTVNCKIKRYLQY